MVEKITVKKIISKIKYGLIKRNIAYISSPIRIFPDFLIIGAVRSGTTSLYYDICEHKCVLPAAYDEIGFFDSNFELGFHWYKSMFPTKFEKNKITKNNHICITGEDTPFYFWSKNARIRIKEKFPKIKLIVLLRNPVDRAYSNYNLGVRGGSEHLSFEESIKKEIFLLEQNNDIQSDGIEKYTRPRSYISKGLYYNQIKKWFELFSKEQILVINTENLLENPEQTLEKVFKFLELSNEKIKNIQNRKRVNYQPMNANTRKYLIDFFKPHNEKLYRIIEKRFEWDK